MKLQENLVKDQRTTGTVGSNKRTVSGEYEPRNQNTATNHIGLYQSPG